MGVPFPVEELELIDITIKMFVEPCLRADIDLLAKIWEHEAHTKQARYEALAQHFGIPPAQLQSQLQSADMFAELLRSQGVEPDLKEGKNGPIYAFAKTDDFMRELLESDNEVIQALAEARQGAKSTQLQTRSATFGFMAQRGPMPVYLRFAGAHTWRWSSGDSTGWQNLKRSDPDNPGKASEIRRAIMAPEGYVLGIVDLSQIECRVLCYLAGQWDYIEKFRNKEDPYVGMASKAYNMPVTKADKEKRGTGKQLVLSCGYMAGEVTIQKTAKLGIYGPPVEIDLVTAKQWKDAYRDEFHEVTKYWQQAGRAISRIAGGEPMEWGPMLIRDKRIFGPGGTFLKFDTLEYFRPQTDEEMEKLPPFKRGGYWRYRTREGWADLYSGKLVENCLSSSTEVLTDSGWKRIVHVTRADRIWDGVAWVTHRGVKARGRNITAPLNGVWMTADHKVLTRHGWARAASAQGLHRAEVRLPDGDSRRRFGWAKKAVVAALRLWARDCRSQQQLYSQPILRMQKSGIDRGAAHDARHEQAPCLLGVAFDGRSLSAADTPSLGKLRRAWHNSMRALAQLPGILGRYGKQLSAGAYAGASQQQPWVQPCELLLEQPSCTGAQHAFQPGASDSLGAHYSSRSGTTFGSWGDDAAVSHQQQLAHEAVVHKSCRVEQTYDIMNCGPRHRFVVRGDTGPFVVHNCVQWLARVILTQAMIRIARRGYRIVTTTHDEIVVLLKKDSDAERHHAVLVDEMRATPAWLPGIPLDAEGGVSERYEK